MPAALATLVCLVFILCLFWTDIKEDRETSHAVWIPLAWMFIAGSRNVSYWLNPGVSLSTVSVYQEGSTLDGAIFAVLIAAGATVLVLRRLDWGALLIRNKWIWGYLLFCGISIVWSDESIIALKRWIKTMGDVIMALVILTEKRPYHAVGTVLRRLAFLILPLSVLFIKYYPDLGRAYHMGAPMYIGVTTQKNSLGQICLICGLYFSWSLMFQWRDEIDKYGFSRAVVNLLCIALAAWLLVSSDSATSMMCFAVVISFFAAGRVPALASRPRRLVAFSGIVLFLAAFLELTFGASGLIIEILGRDPDLTTRVPLWKTLLALETNPLIGVGYESFWSGERLVHIWRHFPGVMQAHNGYLDLYMNVGLIGLLLLLASIISGLVTTVRHLDHDYATSLLRIAFIVAVVLYNWTEATLKPVSNVVIMLLWGILEVSGVTEPREDDEPPDDLEEEPG